MTTRRHFEGHAGDQTGGKLLVVGPTRNINFPYVVLGRALLHLRMIEDRTHAQRRCLSLECADHLVGDHSQRLQLGDDLLRQYIQRVLGNQDAVKFITPDRIHHGHRLNQVITTEREQACLWRTGQMMPGAACALQERRYTAR